MFFLVVLQAMLPLLLSLFSRNLKQKPLKSQAKIESEQEDSFSQPTSSRAACVASHKTNASNYNHSSSGESSDSACLASFERNGKARSTTLTNRSTLSSGNQWNLFQMRVFIFVLSMHCLLMFLFPYNCPNCQLYSKLKMQTLTVQKLETTFLSGLHFRQYGSLCILT